MKAIYTNARKAQELRSPGSLPTSPLSPTSPFPVIETVSMAEHNTLKLQYASLQSQNGSLQGQYNDLRGIWQRQLDESLRFSHENLNLQSELDILRNKIFVQSNDLMQKNMMLEQQGKQNIELQMKVKNLEIEKQNLQNTVVQKDQQLEGQLKQGSEFQCKIDDLEKEKEKLTKAFLAKDSDLQEKTLMFKKNIESWEEQLRKLLPPKGNILETESQLKTTTTDLQTEPTKNKIELPRQTDEIDSNYELVGEIVDSC